MFSLGRLVQSIWECEVYVKAKEYTIKKKNEVNKEVYIVNREVFTCCISDYEGSHIDPAYQSFFFLFFLRNVSAPKVKVKVLCPILCNPMDCCLPRSSIHRILQARMLEWVAISFSRRSSRPSNGTWVSHILGRFFTICVTGDAATKPK